MFLVVKVEIVWRGRRGDQLTSLMRSILTLCGALPVVRYWNMRKRANIWCYMQFMVSSWRFCVIMEVMFGVDGEDETKMKLLD